MLVILQRERGSARDATRRKDVIADKPLKGITTGAARCPLLTIKERFEAGEMHNLPTHQPKDEFGSNCGNLVVTTP
jgi:hypothetical protein